VAGTEVGRGTSVAFIGGPLPFSEVSKSDEFSMAGYLVMSNMLKGLVTAGADVSLVLSVFPRSAWPRGRVLVSRSAVDTLEDGTKVVRLGFLNVTPLKQLWLGLSSFCAVLRWGIRHRRDTKRVVLCYNLTVPPGLFIWLAARVTHSRMIASVFDVDLPGITVPDSVWRRLDFAQAKALMPRVDGIIGVTEWIGRDFAPRVPSICVPCGISDSLASRFSNDNRQVHSGPSKVVFAGCLSVVNGVGLLLDALMLALDIDVRLELIGDGPLLARARSVSERDARVEARGRLSYGDVLEAYASADAVVCIRLQETLRTPYLFPSKLVEGMAVGVPLICTIQNNAAVEIQAVLRRLAIVVESEQPESVVAALRVLTCEDMSEARHNARMLRSWAIENLSWHTECQRILEFIERL
jgi:glycosyltransferase involved in cell wall biosynthesis